MVKPTNSGKRITALFITIFMAIFIMLSSVLALGFSSLTSSNAVEGETDEFGDNPTLTSGRVTVGDLMARYPIDYVVGPVDVKDVATTNEDGTPLTDEDGKKVLKADGVIDRNDLDEFGHYTYIQDDAHKDINGNYTNNIYKVPAEKYFDVESFIYTKPNTGANGGRILYGWKANIRSVVRTVNGVTGDVVLQPTEKLAENGEILGSNGRLTEDPSFVGMHVTYTAAQTDPEYTSERIKDFGSTEQYMLIVPDDITQVGDTIANGGGRAAYVANDASNTLTAYYAKVNPGDKTAWGSDAFTASESFQEGDSNFAEYTDFASFITDRRKAQNTPKVLSFNAPYFWQPRERLAGVYFSENSNLKTIVGGTDPGSNNRSTTAYVGKSPFAWCSSMRFFILPNKTNQPVSVGDYAFAYCSSLVDANKPSSYGTEAYKKCDALIDRTGSDTVFVMGNRPQNGVNDTGAFVFKRTSGGVVTAMSLAGETGEKPDKVFAFPSGTDFTNKSNRRQGVTYDYLDVNANKVKYNLKTRFGETPNITYSIASQFAYEKWCQNVVLPAAVTSIGESAFENAHVKYLETYATVIGNRAFADNANASSEQWYYIHNVPTTVGTGAFSDVANRHIVYESYSLYNNRGSSYTQFNGDSIHYQIPFYAHVKNEDTKAHTFKEGDLAENFFNDSDYEGCTVGAAAEAENQTVTPAENVIVYTKRLNNYAFALTKSRTGEWSAAGDSNRDKTPTLDHMQSTKWYGNPEFSGDPVSADTLFTGNETTSGVDIYTKNVAAPKKIETKEYTFGTAVEGLGTLTDAADATDSTDDGSFAFDNALGLNDDLDGYITEFQYPNGILLTPAASYVKKVRHAGTYSFTLNLDPKWGVWNDDYETENRRATISVARQKFDLRSLDKLPAVTVVPDGSTEGLTLRGNGTTLYRYNDGYYLTEQEGKEVISTVTVTDSYVYAMDKEMTLMLEGYTDNGSKSANGYIMTTSSNKVPGGSGVYVTTYTFEVKMIDGAPGQTDYEFDVTDLNDPERTNTADLVDNDRGVRLDRRTTTGARFYKQWYIITETNFFVDSAVETVGDNTAPYVPVYIGDNPCYTWSYEDEITVKTPKLAYNSTENPVTPTVEIRYTPAGGNALIDYVVIKAETDIAKGLDYYINSSMPVGTYTVIVKGGAVTSDGKAYPATTNTYSLTVEPKSLTAGEEGDAFNALKAAIRGGDKGNAFPLDNKALHSDITSAKDALKATLNTKYSAVTADNSFWKSTLVRNAGTETEQVIYQNGEILYKGSMLSLYGNEITLLYNLEGSGNLIYSAYDSMLDSQANAGAREYRFYFSVAAKNYRTVGGADAADRQDYDFNTTWYEDIKVSEFYKILLGEIESLYFKDVTYTGTAAHMSVAPSQYYSYAFDDTDYINVGRVFVTLTLYNANLARWNDTLALKTESNADGFTQEQIDNASDYFEVFNDGKSLKIYYNITPAENNWDVVPQMPSWSFNGFNADINFITAGLKFPGADYRFALIPKAVDPATVEFNTTKVKDDKGIVYFTVSAEGKVTDAEAIKELNAIKPDDYYLKSFIDGIANSRSGAAGDTQYNVLPFPFVPTNAGAPFTTVKVEKAVNDWSTTPNVMRWSWGSFDPARHTISATAIYPDRKPNGFTAFDYVAAGTDLPEVTFRIVRLVLGEDGKYTEQVIAGLSGFHAVSQTVTYTVDGKEITTTVADILKSLSVGTYRLYTSIGGTDYYTSIEDSAHDFNIMVANNTWDITPGLTGWVYGAFTDGNFRAGAPTFETDGVLVTYKLYEGNVSDVTQFPAASLTGELVTFNLLTDKVKEGESDTISDYLKKLGVRADGYTLVASYEGTGNYEPLEHRITFSVTKPANSWATQPSLAGWTYTAFTSDLFRAGIPTRQESFEGEGENRKPAVVRYTITKKGDSTPAISFTDIAAVESELKTLAAGTYVFAALYVGTDNYDDLPYSAEFVVAPATNTWDITPGLTGWVYGAFAATNFRAGIPAFGKDRTVSYKLYKGNHSTGELPAGSLLITFTSLDGTITVDSKETTASAYLETLGVSAEGYTLVAMLGEDPSGNYGELEQRVTFRVSELTNTWNIQPSISGWTYKAFDRSLFRAGDPTRKESFELDEDGKPTTTPAVVHYTIMRTDGAQFKNALGTLVEKLEFTAIGTVEADLKALAAGSYKLIAFYVGTTDYADLDREVEFAVTPVTNTWEVQPAVSGWQYKTFTASNFRAGVPTLNEKGADVVYALYEGDVSTLSEEELAKLLPLVTFKDLGDKVVEGQAGTVAEYLSALGVHPDGYTLVVTLEESANHSGLKQFVLFSVTIADNAWATQPSISGWNYQGFDASLFRAGVPSLAETVELGEDGQPILVDGQTVPVAVKYTITGIDGTTIDLIEFTDVSKVTEQLNALGTGRYQLSAVYTGTTNYKELTREVQFRVSSLKNTWQTQPTISGWTYKAFDQNLFVAGIPTLKESVKLGEDGKPVVDGEGHTTPALVKYTITGINGTAITPITFELPVTGGELPDDIVKALSDLGAGNYQFNVSYEKTDNYDVLEREVRFQVNKLTNTWQTQPTISGWTYKAFVSDLFVAGVPTLQESKEEISGTEQNAVVHYTITGINGTMLATPITFNLPVTGGELPAWVVTALTGLGAGSYQLLATYAGTNNYDPLPREVQFQVNKLTNTWQTQPSISGWTYQAFVSGNFRAGEPTLNEKNADVVYTLYAGDRTNGTLPTEYLKRFTSLENIWEGEKTIADYLKQLGVSADGYTLVATLEGNDNHSGLEQRIFFAVTPVNNVWTASPKLTSFPYRGFSEGTNFIAGVPLYPEAGKAVYYAILTDAPAKPADLDTFLALDGKHFTSLTETIVDYLNGLSYGTYYFAAYAPGADNYTDLFVTNDFNVTGTSNRWEANGIPAISGWTYGTDVSGVFTAGNALFGEPLYSVQKADQNGNPIEGQYASVVVSGETKEVKDVTAAILQTYLSLIDADRYVLVASVKATDDYGTVAHEVRFTVAKTQNSWADNAPPTITGWTYGSEPNSPSSASASVNTGTIDYKYYVAHQVNGEWIADKARPVANLSEAHAGTYAMVATVPEGTNHFALTHTAIFEISKYNGRWTVEPELTLDWEWGVSETVLQNYNLYKAAVDKPEGAVISYKITGGAVNTTVVKTDLVAALRKLPVGTYDAVVFVDTTDMPDYVYETRRMQITVREADIVVSEDPSCDGWTWGDADDSKTFTQISVGKVLTVNTGAEGDVLVEADATVEYRINARTDWQSFGDMFDLLKTLNAGTYSVEVRVTYANYTTVEYTVANGKAISVEIRHASVSYDEGKAPASWNWTWSDLADEKEAISAKMTELSAHGVNGAAAVLQFTVGGTSLVNVDFDAVKAFFEDETKALAGTYTVTVSVKEVTGHLLANYNPITPNSFAVTIAQAGNEWPANPPQAVTYTKEYGEALNPLIEQAAAKFGTVVYSQDAEGNVPLMYNNAAVQNAATLNNWIKALSSSDEPYTFYTVVKESTNQYDGLSVKTQIQVNGIGSTWANESALKHNVTFTYTDDLKFSESNVVLPIGRTEGESKGTTTYTLTYNGEAIPVSSRTDIYERMNAQSDTKGIAGTYVIAARFKPDSDDYAILNYTVTVEVARAAVAWAQEPNAENSGNYRSIDVTDPTVSVDGCNVPVVITITDSKGKAYDLDGKTLSARMKELDAENYIVTYAVDNTLNYNGLPQKQIRVFISAVPNKWEQLEGSDITSTQWAEGYSWNWERGSDAPIAVEFPKPTIGNVTLTLDGTPVAIQTAAELNAYLNGEGFSRSAGTHTLRFYVQGSVNYNELVSNCTLVISKKENDWKEGYEPQNYVGTGSVDLSKFVIPDANHNPIINVQTGETLIRFDIVKAGGASNENSYGLSTNDFRKALLSLENGTFTVTVRLGGDVPAGASDALRNAWVAYNNDYEALSGSFSITLSPDSNPWTEKFEGNSWTWGDEVNQEDGAVTIAMPAATYGNENIVYTVSGVYSDGSKMNVEFRADKYATDGATQAFQDLIAFFNNENKDYPCHAGTYNVTASIAATGTYAAPTPVTVLFTVNKVQTAWTLSDTDLNRYLNQSIEWGSSTNGLLPVLRIANWEEQKIVYGIDNETLVDDPDTDDKNEGTWSYALANRMFKAGSTYVFTALVAGDINHTALSFRATVTFTPISISWANESEINRVIAWTWHDKDNETPVKPTVSGWEGAVVNFKLTDNATGASYYDGSNWDDMLKELNKRDTGVYLITATVVDPDKNHTPDLSIDISVRINMVTTAWNADSTAAEGAEYDWVYGEDNSGKMPVEPASADWTGDITFTLVKGQTTLYSGKVWNNGTDKRSVLEVLKEQKAGTYVITASIAGDANHTPLTHVQTVVISAQSNSWTSETTGKDDSVETVTWTFGAEIGTGEGKNQTIVFEPTYNKNLLKITVNSQAVDLSRYGNDVNNYLKTLDATSGTVSYTIVASVDGTEEYAGLTRTISLKIEKAGNAWLGADRLNIQANKQGGGSSWLWNNEQVRTDGANLKDINFVLTLPVPQNGDTAVVTVQNGGTETFTFTLHYETVNDVKSVIESDLYALYNRIVNLGVVDGGYKISVTVAESTNFAPLASGEVAFTVEKTANEWAEVPAIGNWTYSAEAPAPSSAAKYGANTVVYSYAPVAENEKDATVPSGEKTWSTAVPAGAGSYWLRAFVDGTNEYDELVGYKKFAIAKLTNDWANAPGVIAWSWDGYNKEANLFSGSSLSGIPVVFKVTLGGNALTAADFDAFDQTIAAKIANGDYAAAIGSLSTGFTEVSDKLADLLNALKPATYSLDVSASGGPNHTDISRSLTFTISPARNEWIADEGSGQAVTPGVASFTYGEYADTLFTEGNVKYGKENVRYKVTGRTLDDKEVDSTAEKAGNPKDGIINPNGFTASEAKAYIALLSAGNYQLVVWVAGGTAGSATQNMRAADMSFADMSEQIYQFKIARAENAWNPAPADTVAVLYDTLQEADTLAAIKFNKPASKSDVCYTVLNSDQTSIVGMSGLNYEDILAKLKTLGYGSYIIRSESAETCNYTAISKDTSLNITRHGNGFDNLTQGNTVHGRWEKDNQTSFTDFAAVTAQHGTVVYTYGGNRYLYNTAALAELTEEERKTFQAEGIYEFMRKQNAGVYDVTVSVAGTNSYEGIENTTMHVNIAAASNAWADENGQAWTIENSIAGKDTQWQWHESVEWLRAVPKYGTTVYFEIRRNRTDSTSLYNATIDYSTDHSSVISGINQTLSQLDVGSYYIFVSARADVNGNWTELSENTYNVQIQIVQADNEWTENPALEHNSWEYQSSFTAITAQAKHGTQNVAYTYYRIENGNDVKLSAMPTDAGSYKVGVSIPQTANYKGVPEVKLPFEITKKLDDRFDVNLSVSDWAWNEYDLNTNRFKGKPTTGGEVTYTILKDGVAVVQEFKLYDAAGIRHKNPDLDLYVDESTRQELNALAKGEYTLQINVAETVNYQSFKTTVPFNVDEAVNAWTTVPQIVSWTQGAALTDENMPKAMSEYGNPTIVITSQAGSIEYYRATYNRATGQYEGESNLQNAPVGYYDMLVTVDAVEGHYGPKLSQKIVFQVFLRGSTDWKNFWEIDPTITSWTANVEHAYGDFNAKGARGSVYFEFYKVERDEDGRLIYDENNPINAENGTLVEKGSKYFKDIYVPYEPGSYYMFARSRSLNPDGTIYEDDNLDSSVYFEILERKNSWTDTGAPKVDTRTLYLGDKDKWNEQLNITSEASLIGSSVSYRFRDGEGNLYHEIPAKVGRYTIVATASAWASQPLVNDSLTIEVVLTPNSWVEVPNIATLMYLGDMEKWAKPTAKAVEGDVAFSYRDAQGNVSDEMPAAEGVYTLIATTTAEYAEVLTGTVEFEIRPSPNKWKELPTIATTLYLGEIENWVAAAAVPEAGTVTFYYQDANKQTEPTTTMPKEPGKYILIAVASSDYYETLREEVEFEIKLSTNRWKDAPVIKDWSAEFEGGNPFAEAEVGSAEDIVYTYAKKESPDEIFDYKPTEEGEYIMYATLVVDGYEPLTARYEFTVSSAYDRQLLMVDIILGTVACAFAVVAIVFAIRRYRENG